MAIIFTDQPTHPPFHAYNNSVVRFKVDSGVATLAKITITGTVFDVYPDKSGLFYFNFKNIVPVLINQSNFADNVIPGEDYFLPDPDLYKEITADFEVMMEGAASQTASKTFPFLKSVKQKGERRHTNFDLRLLDHSLNEISYLTYFEGMPFDLCVYSDVTREVTIRNVMTRMQVTRTFTKGVSRIFISSGENESPIGFENDVPLYEGVNQLEFSTGGQNKFTLFLDKVPADCGKLLKWFNPAGGWSYWRFSNLFLEETRARTKERLYGDFDNLYNSRWNVSITGKDVERTQEIFSGLLRSYELEYVKHITAAPKVYLFVGDLHQPYIKEDFIEVEINGTIKTTTKNMMHQIGLNMVLPTQYSQTL